MKLILEFLHQLAQIPSAFSPARIVFCRRASQLSKWETQSPSNHESRNVRLWWSIRLTPPTPLVTLCHILQQIAPSTTQKAYTWPPSSWIITTYIQIETETT